MPPRHTSPSDLLMTRSHTRRPRTPRVIYANTTTHPLVPIHLDTPNSYSLNPFAPSKPLIVIRVLSGQIHAPKTRALEPIHNIAFHVDVREHAHHSKGPGSYTSCRWVIPPVLDLHVAEFGGVLSRAGPIEGGEFEIPWRRSIEDRHAGR